jgi:hypothetical protein
VAEVPIEVQRKAEVPVVAIVVQRKAEVAGCLPEAIEVPKKEVHHHRHHL